MDDYIKGLKSETDQLISDIEEVKERGEKELNDIDLQIAKLMSEKVEKKGRVDGRLKDLKRRADDKIKLYNQYAGPSPNHSRMENAFDTTPVASPVRTSFFSDTSDSEAEEDDNYYPSQAAKMRATNISRQQRHDVPKNESSRNVKSELDSNNDDRPHGPQGPQINIDDYPILVPHPKDKKIWIQVYCPICKGNMRGDGRWFKGIMGAKRHMRLAHKEVCSVFTNKIIFGEHEVERLIERRFTATEFDDLKNGRIPAPIPKPGTSETVDESFQEKDGLDAYTAFDKYPTIIRRADGLWVELRCPECNGNCVNEHYMNGVAAFLQHLDHDHRDVAPHDVIPAEWVVKRCESRAFTEHELLGLMDDREDAQAPIKVNITKFLAEGHADDEEDALKESSTSRFPNGRLANPLAKRQSSHDVDEYAFTRFKRARESSHLSIRTKADSPSEWFECCPCTLEGHICQYHACSKAKVCMQLDHSEGCHPRATHAFLPLCMMFLLGQACDASTCGFSHDENRKKTLENHDCNKH